MIVQEGDNAIITCEKSLNESTSALWVLSGPQLLHDETLIFNDSISSVTLRDGTKLKLMFENEIVDSDISSNDAQPLMSFRLILLSLSIQLTGLTVKCGVWWEGNQTEVYQVPGIIAVVPNASQDSKSFYYRQLKFRNGCSTIGSGVIIAVHSNLLLDCTAEAT